MNRIVKFLCLVLIVFCADLVQAQHCNSGERSSGFPMLEMLQKHVDISAEQSTTIQEILSVQRDKVAEFKSDSNGDREAFRSAVKLLKVETNTAIAEILTEDQKVLYWLMKENWKDRGVKHFRGERSACCGGKDKAEKGERKARFLEMRVQFEEMLSRKDRKKIKSLRKTMKVAKSEKRDFYTLWKDRQIKPSKEDRRNADKVWKNKYGKELDVVQTLVQKYDSEIQALFNEYKIGQSFLGKRSCKAPLRKKDAGCCEIVDKETCCTSEATTPECCKSKMGKMKARFILMNPKGAGENVGKAESEEVEVSTVQINPNPAKAKATVTYNVKNEGNIKIDLIDESGNFVDNLMNQYKKEGTYQLSFNVNSLQSNKIYFIALTDAVGISNDKLLINKR